MNKNKIVFTGGGTAGHVFPLIGVAKHLDSFKIHYLGSGLEMEKESAKQNNWIYYEILSGKFRRNMSIENVLLNVVDFFKFIAGFLHSILILNRINPALVFSKGGFVALPVCYAAKFLSIPVIIHESDIEMGLANRMCSKFAHSILLGFPEDEYDIRRANTFYTGVPLRPEFEKVAAGAEKPNHILVMGGSLGAVSLNNLVIENVSELAKTFHITHLTGEYDFKRISDLYNKLPEDVRNKYKISSFDKNVKSAMSEASLIIARAGATSTFECSALAKALVLVPIPPSVAPHQIKNANYLSENKMAIVFNQGGTGADFVRAIKDASANQDLLKKEIAKLSFTNSSKLIADRLEDYVSKSNLENYKKIHFIGYKGVSMSQLYNIAESLGISVSGSDLKDAGHSPKYITKDIDLVVYSSAISKDSPAYGELQEAKNHSIKCIKRSEFIGELMKAKKSICVSGMHGKTTVTSAISYMSEKVYPETSYLIGAPSYPQTPSYRYRKYGPIVVEACEYDRSFLDMPCDYAVITNIEEEHLDYYSGGIAEIRSAFEDFLNIVKDGGKVFVNADDANTTKVIEDVRASLDRKKIVVQSVGFKSGDFRINYNSGSSLIEILHEGKKYNLKTSLYGAYNAFNIAMAFAVVVEAFGLKGERASEIVRSFTGPARRFQKIYESKGLVAYDDYAHHPSELRALFGMIDENFKSKKKIVIYEQHQQKRFDEFFDDYVDVLSDNSIDELIILPVFQIAGREGRGEHSIDELANKLKNLNKRFTLVNNYDEAAKVTKTMIGDNSLVVTVGATDVYRVIEKLK